MKRVLLGIFMLSALISSAQTIYWDFGTAAPQTVAVPGLTVSDLSKGNTIATALISNSRESSGYTGSSGGNNAAASIRPGGLKTGDEGSTFFEFTLTPAPGSTIRLHAISFGSRCTSTGPTSYSIRSNMDAYASDIAAGTFSNNSTWSFFSHSSLTVESGKGVPLTIRIFGFNGDGGSVAANWRIDDLTLSAGVISEGSLPVKFTGIKAFQTNSGVQLQWTNLTEADVFKYNLERSSNGKDFKDVSQLPALRNDGGKAEYRLTDLNPLEGNNFYRIKAIEKSGRAVFSDIFRINISGDRTALNLYPNPVKGNHIGLQVDNLPSGIYSLRVYNSSAQLINTQALNHTGGSLSQSLLLNNLKAGVYFLEINGSIKLQKQFVVQ